MKVFYYQCKENYQVIGDGGNNETVSNIYTWKR